MSARFNTPQQREEFLKNEVWALGQVKQELDLHQAEAMKAYEAAAKRRNDLDALLETATDRLA